MTKDYAVCFIYGVYGKVLAIMSRYDVGTAWCKVDVLFESDSYSEICEMYQQYKNDFNL